MKKIGGVRLIGLFLIVFGVIYLNTDNLAFSENYKAYFALIFGLITVIISFVIDLRRKN
jgi:hypothetical protein